MPGLNELEQNTGNLKPKLELQARGWKADPPGEVFQGINAVDKLEITKTSSVKKVWNLVRRRSADKAASSDMAPSLTYTENSLLTETQDIARDEDLVPIDFVSEITEFSKLTQNSAKEQHTVNFSSVEVREHDYTLGLDSRHQDTRTSGPPIELSWDAHSISVVSVDDYEASRGPRREMNMLRKSEEQRYRILKDAGYSGEELQAASSISTTSEIRRIRNLEETPALYEDFQQRFKIVEKKKKPG